MADSDIEMEDSDPPPEEALFLQDSSDEEETAKEIPTVPTQIPSAQQSSSRANGIAGPSTKRNFSRTDTIKTIDDDSDDDIVLLSTPEKPKPGTSMKRKASVSSVSSQGSRRNGLAGGQDPRLAAFDRGFIGSFYCNGWSLSRGKGYVSVGSRIVIARANPKEEAKKASAKQANSVKQTGPTIIKNGKVVKGTAKQATLGSMGIKKSEPPSKTPLANKVAKKVDTIIRFTNDRGFEVGRLPSRDTTFLSPLLDAGIIYLEGVVMDTPVSLTVGCDILLNMKVYLTKKAFEEGLMMGKGKDDDARGRAGNFWQQQGETEEEKNMRLRKGALDSLFNRIGLKPTRSSALTKAQKAKGKATIDEEVLASLTQAAKPQSRNNSRSPDKGKVRKDAGGSRPSSRSPSRSRSGSPSKSKSIKGKGKAKANGLDEGLDESDVESGDEAEILDEKQLNDLEMLYQRAQLNDGMLHEMDPPDTFTYTLRPYQKQALSWMHGLEKGEANMRDQSMHPLWEEYYFKSDNEDKNQPIEIDADDDPAGLGEPFYFNPYDGELSLTFPKANTRARGGILADSMGMGKTCMLASLIHTNREGDVPEKSQDENGDEDGQPVQKKARFRQITLSKQWQPVQRTKSENGDDQKPPHATLVVCPVSLAKQWQDELHRMSTPGSLIVRLWYGNDRADLDVLLGGTEEERVDVIVTSYGTLASEHSKWLKNKDKSSYDGGSLFDVHWLRTVLDEAHTIKNRQSKGAKACYDLNAQRRWALSDMYHACSPPRTPIINRLEDLYSLLHYLRLEPWGQYPFFRTFITQPFLSQDSKALDVVQFILEQCLLRREKHMRDRDGNLIVSLPEKTVTIERLDFSRAERKIYDAIYDHSRRRFIQLDQEGQVKASYTSILAMLMRLRQAVNHPLLVTSKASAGGDDDAASDGLSAKEDKNIQKLIAKFMAAKGDENDEEDIIDIDANTAADTLKRIESGETHMCLFCQEEAEAEVILPCYHTGCRDCATAYIEKEEDFDRVPTCPQCKKPFKARDLRESKKKPTGRLNFGEQATALAKVDFQTSTKLKALIRKLEQIKVQDPKYKALVFSQFTSMLSLVEPVLSDNGVDYLRFDGSMNQKERASVIEAFGKPSTEPKVLLISLKAGGVGLNLTMANHVILLDQWWNEAVESQAIDRVHRLGQTKPVFVTRLIVKGTIERRILSIQRTKTALVNASLAGKATEAGGSLRDLRAIFGMNEGDSSEEE